MSSFELLCLGDTQALTRIVQTTLQQNTRRREHHRTGDDKFQAIQRFAVHGVEVQPYQCRCGSGQATGPQAPNHAPIDEAMVAMDTGGGNLRECGKPQVGAYGCHGGCAE